MVIKVASQKKEPKSATKPHDRSVEGTVKQEPEEEVEYEDDTEEELQDDDQQQRPEPAPGSDLFSFSIDPKILNCSVCASPLSPPLFQCLKGHLWCYSCYTSKNRCSICSICSAPLSRNSCKAIEQILQAIQVPCSNAHAGCTEILSYAWKYLHEQDCSYAPCECPVSDCSFTCSVKSLSEHIRGQHTDRSQVSFSYCRSFPVSLHRSEPFVVLHGKDNQVFLLVNNAAETWSLKGNCVSIVCCSSGSTPACNFSSELTVRSNGRTSNLMFSPANIKRWGGVLPAESFLFVPGSDFVHGRVSVDVRIRRSRSLVLE